jgi:DNA-binding transcriptional MerR regulator
LPGGHRQFVQKIYMISDLASVTGLSRHTLNFYLKFGLIEESGRTESNYRFFDQAVVDRLHCIIALREKGYSLQQIKALLKDGKP